MAAKRDVVVGLEESITQEAEVYWTTKLGEENSIEYKVLDSLDDFDWDLAYWIPERPSLQDNL